MITYELNDKTLAKIAGIVEKRFKKELALTLVLDDSLDEFTGSIKDGVISAGSYAQLLDMAGRVLRNPSLAEAGVDMTVHSHKKISGIYLATHFKNYHDAAPMEEMLEYIDELALWGMNTLKVWFDMHHYHNMEEGKESSDRLTTIMKHAKSIGVKIVLTTLSNEAFDDSPVELRADWTCGHDGYIYSLNDHYHLEICPSKSGGMEQIIDYRRQMLEVFKEAQPDYISIGPYDEGGCTCSECAPWGGNGYIRTVKALIPVIKEYFPDAEIIMSTWQFGTFTGTDVEFEKLEEALQQGLPEVKYIVAEPQYARYPFEHGFPRPLIGFPEISMFHASPWGGYGANPMPALIGRLWRENGEKMAGGYPYSEGFYEDLNKIIVLRYYRDNQSAEITVKEYLSYYFGMEGELLEKTYAAVLDMEETLERSLDWEEHRYVIARPEKVPAVEKAILEVHEELCEEIRESKRWQMIYLRAMIDGELVRSDFYRNDKVMGYYKRLIELSHLQNSGKWTRPDVNV